MSMQSKLSLGTAQWGMDYGWANRSGRPGISELETMLEMALAAGVRHLDTAQCYGNAEEILGALGVAKAGFKINSTKSLTKEKLPREIKIKVAYDVEIGNPYKNYSTHDFSVGKGGSIKSKLSPGTKVIGVKENEWILEINSLPFSISVTGFDVNRDLSISVR